MGHLEQVWFTENILFFFYCSCAEILMAMPQEHLQFGPCKMTTGIFIIRAYEIIFAKQTERGCNM